MIQEEINENNKLIAEFMDGKEVDWFSERVIIMPFAENINKNNYLKLSNSYILDREVKYHYSYEWLMPVVDKISKVVIKGNPPYNNDQYARVEIVPNGYVKISNFRDSPITKNISIEGSLINAIYKAVVLFIKWYNKLNSNENTN